MKIHEYQAKSILKKYNIPIQDGYTLDNIKDAKETILKVKNDFNTDDFVVKAQIHAGGRGKGGGVKYSPDFDSAFENAKKILGMNLVTPQTGEKGKLVKTIYITEAFNIKKEYYVAITLDRERKKDVFMVSTEGGVNIEEVAKNTPEKITKIWIEPLENLSNEDAEKLADSLKFDNELKNQSKEIFINLYKCYKEMDCTILEVNP
ncbi:succinate--CoA ligase subunit beta, partial [Candidatus Marinimicrobia bacterium]|nr:succinate--CoA ligase subunit beta [Candidatus Neomarinimicrobiota bacterium]